MALYCVNKKAQTTGRHNGQHEVHNVNKCDRLPNVENRKSLGYHASCKDAVKEAKKIYWNSNGCYWCARECDTG